MLSSAPVVVTVCKVSVTGVQLNVTRSCYR
jgi:hypothetical protein